jgi:hypothetical protein
MPYWRNYYKIEKHSRVVNIMSLVKEDSKTNSFLIVPMLIYSFSIFVFIYFFKTLDFANIRTFLMGSSYLFLNQNPYGIIPLPPPILFAYLIPGYRLFLISGSLHYEVVYIQILNLLFVIASALIIYKIVYLNTNIKTRSYSAFIAFLLSPAVFIFLFIFDEQDIIGIFYMLLSYYLLLLSDKYNSSELGFVGGILLAYSTFIYYFPILIFPTIIIYEKRNYLRLSIVMGVIIGLGTSYFNSVRILNWNFLSTGIYLSSVGGKGFVPPYSILNFLAKRMFAPVTPIISEVFSLMVILLLLFSILIPISLRRYNIPRILSLSIIMNSAVILLRLFNPDEFIWAVPFPIILISTYSTNKHLKLILMVTQLWIFPVFILFDMWTEAAYGAGTGITYLLYSQYGKAIYAYSYFNNPFRVTELLNGLILLFLLIFDVYLWFTAKKIYISNHKTNESLSQKAKDNEGESKKNFYLYSNNYQQPIKNNIVKHGKFVRIPNQTNKLSLLLLTLLIIFLLIFPSIILITHSPSSTYYQDNKFPLALFNSDPIMNKSLTYSYAGNKSLLSISSSNSTNAEPIILSRNITGENFNAMVNFKPILPNNILYSDCVLSAGDESILLGKGLFLDNYTKALPSLSINTSIYNTSVPVLGIDNVTAFSYNGDSYSYYPITLQNSKVYVLAFQAKQVYYYQNLVLDFLIQNTWIQLFVANNILYFGYAINSRNATWVNLKVNTYNNLSFWNVFSFSFINETLNFSVNGENVYHMGLLKNLSDQINFNVGKFYLTKDYNYNNAFDGNITQLLILKQKSVRIQNYTFISNSIINRILTSPNFSYKISYLNNIMTLTINSYSLSSHLFSPTISFGRFSIDSPGLLIQIINLSISTAASPNMLFSLLAFAFATPFSTVCFSLYVRRIQDSKINLGLSP